MLRCTFWEIFILLGLLWASCICGLVSGINLGRFLVLIVLNISYVSFFLLLPVFPLHVCYTFFNCPTILKYSVLGFFPRLFSLCFLALEVSIEISLSQRYIYSVMFSINELIKDILYFGFSVFARQHFFLILSKDFHLCFHCSSVHEYGLLYRLEYNHSCFKFLV